MAPRARRGDPAAPQAFHELGVRGRKTGVVLPEGGERDEHGMQRLEGIFSPPNGAGAESGSEDMDIESSSGPDPRTLLQNQRGNARLPLPTSRSPAKPRSNSPVRKAAAPGETSQKEGRRAAAPAGSQDDSVSRKLDFAAKGKAGRPTKASRGLNGAARAAGRRDDGWDAEANTSEIVDLSAVSVDVSAVNVDEQPAGEGRLEGENDEVVTPAPRRRGRPRKSLEQPKKSELQKPEPDKAETQKPEARKPEPKRSEPKKSEPQKAEAKKPESQKPESQKAEAKKPESQKPESQKPESQQPEPKTPEPQEPELEIPESQIPESQKPESQKPESQKPEPQKPEPSRPSRKRPSGGNSSASPNDQSQMEQSRQEEEEDEDDEEPRLVKRKRTQEPPRTLRVPSESPTPSPPSPRPSKAAPKTSTAKPQAPKAKGRPVGKVKARRQQRQDDADDDDEGAGETSFMALQRGPPMPKSRGLVSMRRNADGVTQTRSGRHSFRPIEYWRGEQVVRADEQRTDMFYARDDFVVPSVKQVVRVPPDEPPLKRPAPRGGGKGKATARTNAAALLDAEPELEDWELDPGTVTGEVVVWEPEHEAHPPADDEPVQVMDDRVAISADAIRTSDIKDATFRFAKTLTTPFMGAGVVDLPPSSEKRPKNSRKMHMVFFVHYGKVLVTINDAQFRISTGGTWFVPRGNYYSVTNDYDVPARIFFAQACEVQVARPDDSQIAPDASAAS